jgi:hypothetical protein
VNQPRAADDFATIRARMEGAASRASEGAKKGDGVRAGAGARQQNWSGRNCRPAVGEPGGVELVSNSGHQPERRCRLDRPTPEKSDPNTRVAAGSAGARSIGYGLWLVRLQPFENGLERMGLGR